MINPACTPGVIVGRAPDVDAFCGCGWSELGLPSKSAAKRAQRTHRFPPYPQETPMSNDANARGTADQFFNDLEATGSRALRNHMGQLWELLRTNFDAFTAAGGTPVTLPDGSPIPAWDALAPVSQVAFINLTFDAFVTLGTLLQSVARVDAEL